MKYLILFEKGETARWLGHLDILRTFERAIRRADLPIAFSSGFNPRERLAFASALSVGVTGAKEPMTIELVSSIDPPELVQRLNEKLPPGIQLSYAEEIPDLGSRDLLNSYDRAEVQVICVCGPEITVEAAQSAAEKLLAQTEIIIEREREGKTKKVNIRPMIYDIQVGERTENRITFNMVLSLGTEGTAKPPEIVGLMAEDLPGLAVRRVHRAQLLAREGDAVLEETAS
jgi:radical SAM-linked protein